MGEIMSLNYPYFFLFLFNYLHLLLYTLIFNKLHWNVKLNSMSSNIRIKSTCDFCGNEFTAKTLKTRYCSHTCNSRDYKQRLKKNRVNKEVKVRNNKTQLESLEKRDYLSVKEVAVLMGCSTKTVYRLVKDGTIKSANLSVRLIRINRKALEKVIPQL